MPPSPLAQEAALRDQTLAVLASAAATGFATLLPERPDPWVQWTWLAHVFLGFWLALGLAAYLARHLRRAFGLRRPWVSIGGGAAALVFLGSAATGVHMALLGQMEAARWVYDWHILLSSACLLALLAHAAPGHLFSAARKNRPAQPPPQRRPAWGPAVRHAAATGLGVALLSAAYAAWLPAEPAGPAVQPYQTPYGPHPFRPSQTETSTGAFVPPAVSGGSAGCGACHAQIAREWQASIHSQAGADKSYQRNVKLLAEKKGIATTRYCEGCHAPVALLSGQLSQGGRLDTEGHLREGVGCLGCHGIDQAVHVKGVASFRFAPPADYLFARRQNPAALTIHNYLLRVQPRQHRRDMARDVLASPRLCATCHVQFMDKDVNQWGWVQMQDEYTGWLNSPYSGQTRQAFAEGSPRRCQDCHFPQAPGEDPSADAQGRVRSHLSLGANTAIPHFTGDQAQLARTREFLRADKVRVAIDVPDRPDATQSAAYVAPGIYDKKEVPDYSYIGERLAFNVVVANAGVGHAFPGGTTDINEAWLYVRVSDGQNATVFESGALGGDGEVDKDAYFYRTLPIDRQGNLVWRHDLFNMVGDSFKRVVAPGKSDIVPYSVEVPAWAKSPLTVSAALKYRKFNNRYARWALEDENIRLPVVDMSTDSLSIPVRLQPEVETPGPEQAKAAAKPGRAAGE